MAKGRAKGGAGRGGGRPRRAAPARPRPRPEGVAEDAPGDLYEAEEEAGGRGEAGGAATEDGRRYDAVDNFQYELPSDFEDEEIDSDEAFDSEDEERFGHLEFPSDKRRRADEGGAAADDGYDSEEEEEPSYETGPAPAPAAAAGPADDDAAAGAYEGDDESGPESDDEERYQAMVGAVARARDAAAPRARRAGPVATEALPEDEFNVQGGAARPVTLAGLVGSLAADPAVKTTQLRKDLERLQARAAPTEPPQPRVVRERAERRAGYGFAKKDVSKWQALVKENREAPTLAFKNRMGKELEQTRTTSALASKFRAEGDMEREVAALLAGAAGAQEAERLQLDALEEHALGAEEQRARQAKLAKMRHLMFYHEMKAKRTKAIKSKSYHRHLKKQEQGKRAKAGPVELDAAQAAEAKEQAEFLRAQERLTLRHKNTSRWARRALKRGMAVMDDGTKQALGEQLRISEALKRKVEMADASEESESESSSLSDGDAGADDGGAPPKSAKAKAAVLRELEEDPEAALPEKGLFALPFMKRALQRKRTSAKAEAERLLQDLEEAEEASEGEEAGPPGGAAGPVGRLHFAAPDASAAALSGGEEEEGGADGEAEGRGADAGAEAAPTGLPRRAAKGPAPRHTTVTSGPVLVAPEVSAPQQPAWLFGSGPPPAAAAQPRPQPGLKRASIAGEAAPGSGSESEGPEDAGGGGRSTEGKRRGPARAGAAGGRVDMALAEEDGFEDQRALIKEAFQAFGEDVQKEFAEAKAKAVERELPKFDAPALMPGWGTWKDQQKTPQWMLDARREADRKKQAAAAKRKDAHLKHVILSEKYDKKAARFAVTEVPFPFKSREDYERSQRMPLGREFNTDKAFRDLTRAPVLKTTGVMIDPLRPGESLDSRKVKETAVGGPTVPKRKKRKVVSRRPLS